MNENKMNDLLQERLELLEAGEPFDVCAEGLPGELIEALGLAAAMRDVTVPAPAAEKLRQERAALLELAAASLPQAQQINTERNYSIMEKIQTWIQARTTFDWIMAAVLGPAVVVVVLALFASLFTAAPERVVVEEEPTAASEIAAQPTAEAREEAVDAPTTTAERAEPTEAADSAAASADSEPAETEIAVVPEATTAPYEVYVPFSNRPFDLNPATALLDEVRGIVEVQTAAGEWARVERATTLTAGDRVRTADFSGATLTFYDGSEARLEANNELSIDTLNALRPEEGFRDVVLTQWQGESEHHVEFRNDRGSRYEVKNPEGTGIARGTIFRVAVLPEQQAQYTVLEGRVDVTSINITVSVIAGQLTVIPVGEPPSSPVFSVTGQGEVTQTGETWIIGGQTFQTSDTTVIVGNPEIGDFVTVQGHLDSNGERVADVITLLRRDVGETFTITGEVSAIGDETWTVAGQAITISETTTIDAEIAEGETVQVTGVISDEGDLLAETILLVEESLGLPFEFVGLAESIGADSWVVSGQTVMITETTTIDEGIEEGDTVQVAGYITAEQEWIATSVTRYLEEEAQFSFVGDVASMDPWVVSGIGFETRPWTIIDPNIAISDTVRVSGIIDEAGTWIAAEIALVEEDRNLIVLIGTLESIEPWIVDGLELAVNDETVIGEVEVDDQVRVVIELLPNGEWITISIEPLSDDVVTACFTINDVVLGFSGGVLNLEEWEDIQIGDVPVVGGSLAPNTVVAITICVNSDGEIVSVGEIIVVTVIIVVAPPPAGGGGGDDDGGSTGGGTTLCHRPPGNPDNAHTITVGPGAVDAHLGHGDTLGPCN